jgi:hypothetical protein
VDINQCASSVEDDGTFNIFGGTDKCKTESTFVRSFELPFKLSLPNPT